MKRIPPSCRVRTLSPESPVLARRAVQLPPSAPHADKSQPKRRSRTLRSDYWDRIFSPVSPALAWQELRHLQSGPVVLEVEQGRAALLRPPDGWDRAFS